MDDKFMKKHTTLALLALIIAAYATISSPGAALAETSSPVVNLITGNEPKKDTPPPAAVALPPIDRTAGLSAEAKAALKQLDTMMEKVTPKTKEELKNFSDARKALYDKLSPAAKDITNRRISIVQNFSAAIKTELKNYKEKELE
jgi:hypothetical protein